MKTKTKLLNTAIKHHKFGTGSIVKFEDELMHIDFATVGVKKFLYPDAFSSYLMIEDLQLSELVKEDLESKLARIKAEKEELTQKIEQELEQRKLAKQSRKKKR